MPCTVHFLEKDDFIYEIFQVGACPESIDSLIYENFPIHMYKS